VKGVVDAEVELEELLPPPAQATIVNGTTKVRIFFTVFLSVLGFKKITSTIIFNISFILGSNTRIIELLSHEWLKPKKY
jgi:hypothetical protein